jgi:outer membrane protein TolC
MMLNILIFCLIFLCIQPIWAQNTSHTQQSLYAIEKHSSHDQKTLVLYDILEKITQTHPLIIAKQAQIKSTEADLMIAQGYYDFEWYASSKMVPQSTKDEWAYQDTSFSQLTTFWGTSLYGGYGKSFGHLPIYAQDLKTKDLGKFNLGLNMPLLQGRVIDEYRAKLAQNKKKIDIAELDLKSTLLKLYLSVAKSYWKWIASAHKVYIDARLLEMANERASQIQLRIQAGDAAPIEGIENQQALLKRKGNLIKSQQALKISAYDLALYLRDDAGNMQIPQETLVPMYIPDAKLKRQSTLAEDQLFAIQHRPTIAKIEQYLEVLKIDIELADNQTLPKLDLSLQTSQSVDTDNIGKYNDIQAGLKFKLPVQRRKAKGAYLKAKADLEALEADLKFQKDLSFMEVADARISLEASLERILLAEQELDFAQEVENAERTKLKLGDSSLFILNLREQATADAGTRLIEALTEFHINFAIYLSTTGHGMSLNEWK